MEACVAEFRAQCPLSVRILCESLTMPSELSQQWRNCVDLSIISTEDFGCVRELSMRFPVSPAALTL